MNCALFETYAADLARGEAMDAGVREPALAHALECARCAAVLADHRSLTGGLRALGAASPLQSRGEAAVLAAFRAHRALPPKQRRNWKWLAGAAAAAACVLMVWQAVAPVPVETPARTVETRKQVLPRTPEQQPLALAKASEPPKRVRRPRRPVSAPSRQEAAPQVETATEFMPIPYSPAWTPYDRGQVVRVRLPRSSMRTFGLPVSEDRYYEKVQADVLLGEDGIARAVRFVSNR